MDREPARIRHRPELPLQLVYNPNGAFLPDRQAKLEADYKRELQREFGIGFNRLFALAHLPIARVTSWLRHNSRQESYLELLANAFNPETVEGLMCRDTINVSWTGQVFDCDFNQMLNLRADVGGGENVFLWDLQPAALADAPIRSGEHCFGCTAGADSSCGGAIETPAEAKSAWSDNG